MRKHIRYIAVAVAAASMLSLAGCSAGNDGEATGHQTITLLMSDPADRMKPALDGFAKANPDITVNYEYVPFDQYANLIEQRIGGKDAGVDVYAVDSGTVGALASKGYLVDLSDLASQVKKESLPATAEANTFKGKLWSVPLWDSMQYLYYNKSILDAAGIPYPSADPTKRTTFQELLEDGKKAQSSGATWGLLFDQTSRYYQMQALIESAGGGSGASGKDLLTADVNNAGWVKAMDWYSKLFADGVAPKGVATEQMKDIFAAGQAAYIISGPWQVKTNATAAQPIKYGIAPNPVFEGGKPAMSTGSWNLGINPSSQHQAAAKKLIEYLALNKEGNTLTGSAGYAPALTSTFDNYVGDLDKLDAPNTDGLGALTLEELQNVAVNRPNSPGFNQLADVTGRAFEDIRNGQPVTSTLNRAQTELQGLWDRLK